MDKKDAGKMQSNMSLAIHGMSCASCVMRIEKVGQAVPGVESLVINLATEKAQVKASDSESIRTLVAAIQKVGFKVQRDSHEMSIRGMSCASCVGRIEAALLKIPGILSASVNLATETAEVQTVHEALSFSDIALSVSKAGYTATRKTSEEEAFRRIGEQDLHRETAYVIAGVLLSLPLVLPMLFMPFGWHVMLPGWIQLVLTLPVQFILGADFYRSAWSAIKMRSANMDVLVALGTTAAFGLSLFNLIKHNSDGHQLYFESSSVVITLVRVGKLLERRAKRQTTSSLLALHKLRPTTARVKRFGTITVEPLAEVRVGDHVVVQAGEIIPVDGEVLEGNSAVDESLVTGESLSVEKSAGDRVTGGSTNTVGVLILETKAVGIETMLSKIIRMVESAQAQKAPIQKLVDRVSAVFVPIVLLVAIVVGIGFGLWSGQWEEALMRSVAVLVIACPCALGLATPTSIMVGTGTAARSGILIRDPEAIQRAQNITLVAFDKTGTLTQGRPEVTDIVSVDHDENVVLRWTAAVQAGSGHPLAQACVRKAVESGVNYPSAQSVTLLPGGGLSGTVEGIEFTIVTPERADRLGYDISIYQDQLRILESNAKSVSFVLDSTHGRVLALFAFQDTLRLQSKSAIDALHRLGIKTQLLSGDNEASVAATAKVLGIPSYQARALPSDKARIIKEAKERGEAVAMVGDGINDAPALTEAQVGIAMGGGADVAMQTAGITLMNNNPLLVAASLDISRRTYQKIKQNLFWAFFYNIIGIPLASLGILNPIFAAGAMALSSVCVVGNALLLARWRPHL